MITYLTPLTQQRKSKSVTSQSFTVPSYRGVVGQFAAVALNGAIVLNGVPTGGSNVNVVAGDVLSIQATSSSTNCLTVQASIAINSDIWVFAITTADGPKQYVYPDYVNVGPLDNLVVSDSSKPSAQPNFISVLSSTDGGLQTTIPMLAPQGASTLAGNDYLTVADYYQDRVLVIDKTSRSIIEAIDLPSGSRPSACAYTHDPVTSKDYTWVTASGLNKLLKIDIQLMLVVQEIYIPERPLGLTVSHYDNSIWVVCERSNTVTKLAYDGSTIFTSNVALGPTSSCLDVDGNLWVACSKSNKVCVVNNEFGTVQTVVVGENPWDVKIVDGNAYVTNSFDGTISTIMVWNQTLTSTSLPICLLPGDMLVDRSKNLWVLSFAESTVFKLVNGVVKSTASVPATPLSMSIDDDDNLWVVSMYSGVSPRTYIDDYAADRLAFLSVLEATKNTVYVSNTVTISGLPSGITIPCSIPQISGFDIIKNGISVGTATSISNGDTISLQQTSDNTVDYNVAQTLEFCYGQSKAFFTVTTLSADRQIDSLSFIGQDSCLAATEIVSNEVTITGSTVGIYMPISVTKGILVINGVDSGISSSITVGDKVKIKLTTGVNAGEFSYTKVTSNLAEDYWVLRVTPAVISGSSSVLPADLPTLVNFVDIPINSVVSQSLLISGLTGPKYADRNIGAGPIPTNAWNCGVSAKHWRLQTTRGTTFGWTYGIMLSEITLISKGVNIAGTAVASASTNNAIANLINDGDNSTSWRSLWAEVNPWVQLDFPDAVVLDSVTIQWADSFYTPQGYNIEYSLDDGTTWQVATHVISGVPTLSLVQQPAPLPRGSLVISDFPGNSLSATSVGNGDVVIVKAQAPSMEGETITKTVYFNNLPITYTITARITTPLLLGTQPNAMLFQDVVNAIPGNTYTSNTVTISGLADGKSQSVIPTSGLLRLNGVAAAPLASVTVKNGDILEWVIVAAQTTTYRLSFGQYSSFWSIYRNDTTGVPIRNCSILGNKKVLSTFSWIKRVTQQRIPTKMPLKVAQSAFFVFGVKQRATHAPAGLTFHRTPKTLRKAVRNTSSSLTVYKSGKAIKPTALVRANALPNLFHNFKTNASLVTLKVQAVRSNNHYAFVPITPPTAIKVIDKTYRPLDKVPIAVKASSKSVAVTSYSTPIKVTTKTYRPLDKVPISSRSHSSTRLLGIPTAIKNKDSLRIVPTLNWIAGVSNSITVSQHPIVTKPKSYTKSSIGSTVVLLNTVSHAVIAKSKTFEWSRLSTIEKTHIEAKARIAVCEKTHTVSKSILVISGKIHSAKVPMVFVKEKASTHGDKGLGVANTYRTLRFMSSELATADGQTTWRFTNVQPVDYGDGTFIWIGDCASYKPFKSSGYLSGG